MKKISRHGDLGITPIEKVEGSWKKHEELVLALGEATGHSHVLTPNKGAIVECLKGYDDVVFFRVCKGTATLKHQEHHTLTIQEGTYEIHREREWDYFENDMRKVVD